MSTHSTTKPSPTERWTQSPLSQLVLGLCSQTQTDPTKLWEGKNITKWHTGKNQPNKLECYLALSSDYTVAKYLTTVTDHKLRKSLTMYRFSEHSLAIERRRHRQTWLSREDRICLHCPQNEVETELHFLTSCQCMTTLETHTSHRFHRPTRNLKTNPALINSHIC